MAILCYARQSVERENSISCETQLEYCKSVIKPDGILYGGRQPYGFELIPAVINNIKTKKLNPMPALWILTSDSNANRS